MTRIHGFDGLRHDHQADEDRQTNSLAALALVLALVVLGLFLFRTLSAENKVEDCLLAGRSNCDAVLAHHPVQQAW